MATLAIKQRSLMKEIKETGISKEKLIKLFEELDGEGDQGRDNCLNLHQVLDRNERKFKELITEKQLKWSSSKLLNSNADLERINIPSDERLFENVQEFMRKDEHQMWNEIKDFVNKYKIRHVVIANMTKIYPESISKYLREFPSYISFRAKLRLYTWYNICKDQPDMISNWYPQGAGCSEKGGNIQP